jgi:hypothetical protein
MILYWSVLMSIFFHAPSSVAILNFDYVSLIHCTLPCSHFSHYLS